MKIAIPKFILSLIFVSSKKIIIIISKDTFQYAFEGGLYHRSSHTTEKKFSALVKTPGQNIYISMFRFASCRYVAHIGY